MRTRRTQEAYDNYNKSFGEFVHVEEYLHWMIVENKFPYDAAATIHHLLLPKRKVAKFYDLNAEEIAEYKIITNLREIETRYDCILKNFPHKRTVPEWWHSHLIKWKKVIHSCDCKKSQE